MNNFTQIFLESKKSDIYPEIDKSIIKDYLTKLDKKLPVVVKNVIYLTDKYNLYTKESIDAIRSCSKGSLRMLSKTYNIPLDNLEDLWKMIKDLHHDVRLLPQMLTEKERIMFETGKLKAEDLVIDLETPKGRNEAVKMYMPVVYKIVNQYVDKSKLDKTDLISSAMEGVTKAINDWEPEKGSTFKTYLSYRVKQQILDDINKNGHDLSGTSWYSNSNGSVVDATSLDAYNDDDSYKLDKILSIADDESSGGVEEKEWQSLYKLLEDNFKQRDVVVFYRFFGLNGYKKEKSKDIAKEFGWHESGVRTIVINKMLAFLRKDKRAVSILAKIQDSYMESLMISMIGTSKEFIIETLLQDDIYILLEELNRWNNKSIFIKQLHTSLAVMSTIESDYIINILEGDFDILDSTFKKNKETIILFLSNMYPTETMSKKTDVSLLEYMQELQNIYKKHIK